MSRAQQFQILFLALLMALPFAARADDTQASQTQNDQTSASAAASANTTSGSGGGAQNTQPSASAAYDFKNEGIFGCNQIAGANGSAGVMTGSGVFVPVNDAAVTLNTGIEEYHQCILRPLQDRLRESATSALLKKQLISMLTGRNGNPQFVANIPSELLNVSDRARLATYTDGSINAAPAVYQAVVRSSNARSYQQNTRNPNSILTCPYQGDLAAADSGTTDDPFGGVLRMMYPACYALGSEEMYEQLASTREAIAVSNQQTTWDWSHGFYPITDNASDPLAERTRTPGIVEQETFQTVLNSPIVQLQSANDIGQMIGALFAGTPTQATTDSQGLTGLAQSVGGQPSYLDQVAKESSQGVIGAAVNAAIAVLNPARAVEVRYLNAVNAIASTLTQTIKQIRGIETQCWTLVVPQVRSYAASNGIQLDEKKINAATSSFAFSQQVINSQITPLATVALQNVQASQQALGLIDQLIAGVTNTNSLDAQRVSLQQLDSLVAQHLLHVTSDATNAEQQQKDITSTMQDLITSTAQAWGDSTDPSVGWCNVNNTPTIPQLWAQQWKK